jgi:very-long-chain enoyl-CoA reductase
MVGIHFLKRILEVLFVHSYSGSPIEDCLSSSVIGLFYAVQSWCYYKNGVGANGLTLAVGLLCFCIGIVGNFWHHLILAKLRSQAVSSTTISHVVAEDSSKYKIPQGGLFGLAACPHYMFEIIGFWGIAAVSRSVLAVACALNTTLLLAGHSSATTRWYQKRFGDSWPQERKHMVPFVY